MLRSALLASIVLAAAPAALAQPDCGSWDVGLFPRVGTDAIVLASAVFDDGSGPALFVGGTFTHAGALEVDGIAKWDGAAFSPLPSGGVEGSIGALIVFDDGTGPALYAGGFFTSVGGVPALSVAKWDGASWSALGAGLEGGGVSEFAVYDDGSGPALHVGGSFTSSGGAPASRIARWDVASGTWLPLGAGMDNWVTALLVHDDGSGPKLFAAGLFTQAGGVAASRIASWDGAVWAPLNAGLDNGVGDLLEFDDGAGPVLFAVGSFLQSGFTTVPYVGRWDGSFWSGLPGPFLFPPFRAFVHDFTGSGPELVVGETIDAIYRRSNNQWVRLTPGNGQGAAVTFAVFDDGSGATLYAGGSFVDSRGVIVDHFARWSGAAWLPASPGVASAVESLLVHDDGGGRALFAGASVRGAGDVFARGVARWDGNAWSALGTGVNATVFAMTEFAGDLVVGGDFTMAGGAPAERVARWDGAAWSPLGAGIDGSVRALAVFDDGTTGPSLYAAGLFENAGGVATKGVARWDGAVWHSVAGGITGGITSDVCALAVHDDGSGARLYVGGHFMEMGGVAALNIARWDGAAFTPVGPGLVGSVFSLESYLDGTGAAAKLFAGGVLATTDFLTFDLAVWDGAAWGGEGGGGVSAPGAVSRVDSLAVVNFGLGPEVVAGGFFTLAGGLPANSIARWNGVAWSTLGPGAERYVRALAAFLDGREGAPAAALYAGGDFTTVSGGVPASRLARYFDPCAAAAGGTVGLGFGAISDILFVNDSGGGVDRRVDLGITTSFRVVIGAPSGQMSAPFALYGFAGGLPPADVRLVPGLGFTARPTPLSPGPSPKLRAIWNNTGVARLGAATLPSTNAPTTLVDRPNGAGRALTFTLQGVIRDPGSAARKPWSVTNAVVVSVR